MPDAFLISAKTRLREWGGVARDDLRRAHAYLQGRMPRELSRPVVIALRAIGIVFAALLLAWAILYITKGRFLKGPFESIASSATARDVRVAGDFQFYFNPINVRFVAEGLSVSNPEWVEEGNFFDAGGVVADIATFSFLFGERRINRLDLRDARVDLRWDAEHRRNSWTLGDPDRPGKPFDLPLIRSARAAGTELTYRDPKGRLSAELAVDTVDAEDSRFASVIRFRGEGTARDSRFTIGGALLSPNATVGGASNRLEVHLRGADIVADISGTLPGATQIEGADLHLDVRGGNMANLFAVLGVAIPETRDYRVRSAFTKAGDEWRFTGLKGRFGESDIAGKLTVALIEPRLKLTAELRTDTLDIVDIAPIVGYDPDRVAARGSKGLVQGSGRVLPDASLRVDALGDFDADVKYAVRRVRAEDFPISDIDLGLTLDDRMLTLSPLTFNMARGHVTADIGINARRDPVFTEYDIRLSPTPMGVLLAGFGVAESGTSGTLRARVQLAGAGNSIHDSLGNANGRIAVIIPRGSMWTRNVQLSELDIGLFIQKMFEDKLEKPVEINCGLIGFTVRDGIAAADPILIDTRKNVMLGRGGFSFRTERFDLAFRADGKQFSLFSGQSPVGLGGSFANPKIDVISGELLARAGASLGLAVVASPLAAVLAFVDVGDAKAADCGPVLSGARASAQRDEKGRPRDDVGNGTTSKEEN